MVATDLDGTLLRADHSISDRTLAVLTKVREAGVIVVAATGRGPLALPNFDRGGPIEIAVCSNGAAVVDVASGEVVDRRDLPGRTVATTFAELRSAIPGASFAWEAANGFGWEPPFAAHGNILLDAYAAEASAAFDPGAPVSKAFVAHDCLGYQALAQRVSEVMSVEAEVSSAGLPFVVITAPNVTKATALQELCDQRGIERTQVVAFGDSWNDLDMLNWAGLGVAMGNANEDVKAAADEIAGSHETEGVANYLVDLLNL